MTDIDRAVTDIQRYLEANAERHLARVQTLLRQPSVSVDGSGLETCARLFADLLKDSGFPEVAVVPTSGSPGVWGSFDAGRPRTLVTYGMLDVRRADPALWRVPPFSAVVVDHPVFPKVLIARGARSVKGPLGVWLNAVEACRAVLGAPPVNLLVLAETDEILGSPTYREMVERYRSALAAGDSAWSPGAAQDAEGHAHLTLGYKGLIYASLRATGRRWGRGPRDGPIHGMAKSVVDSPAWRLVQALATLTGPDGNTIHVPLLNRDLDSPAPDEVKEMEAIRRRFGSKPWQQVLPGVQGAPVPPVNDMLPEDVYRKYFFGPSLNVSGLRSGYVGPGTTTFTLPHQAEAFLDIRIPRTWDVREVLESIRTHLDDRGFADVEIEVFGAFNGSQVARDAPILRAASAVFAARDVEVILWPMTGGGGPWSLFAEEFGMPVLRDIGMGHGMASATEEYLVVEGKGRVGGIIEMALSHAELMLRMAS